MEVSRKKKKQAINIFLFTKWGQTHPLQETMVWVRFFFKYGCFCEDRRVHFWDWVHSKGFLRTQIRGWDGGGLFSEDTLEGGGEG